MNTEDDKTQVMASNGGTRAEVRHKMTDTARCIARMSACRRWPRRMRIKGRDCWNSTAAPPTHAGQIADKCVQLLDTTLILRLNPALSSSHPTLKPYSPSRQYWTNCSNNSKSVGQPPTTQMKSLVIWTCSGVPDCLSCSAACDELLQLPCSAPPPAPSSQHSKSGLNSLQLCD